jgi:hypothetical protein
MFNPILCLVDKTPNTVTINAVSALFGSNNMVIPLSHEKFMACYDKWMAGENVQVAFSTLTTEQREFLVSGMSIKQQKEVFGSDSNPEAN